MSAIKQTKLFIEKLKNKNECEVVIRIGKFKSKEEAAALYFLYLYDKEY